MATRTVINRPATINGQPANGATRTIVYKDGVRVSDTGFVSPSGTIVAGSSYTAPTPNPPVSNATYSIVDGKFVKNVAPVDFNKVSVGQVKAAGFNNLTEYKNAYYAGNAPNPGTIKPIQTFSSGTYNPNTGAFIDNQGRGYSTMEPAKLDAQIKSGPAIKSAGLDASKVASAPTSSVVAAVATKTVIDENSSIQDVVKAGNEAAAAAIKARESGAFKNIKTVEPSGYDFGTYQTPGGIVSLGPLDQIFGEQVPIAVDKKTGQKYKIVQTGDLESTFARNTIGLTKDEKASISQKIYGVPIDTTATWFNKGYSITGDPIELGVKTPVSQKEKEALAQFQQNIGINEAGFKFAAGITLGGGGKVVNTATQTGGAIATKAGAGGLFQTIKPYLISAGLYAGGTQAPELARQVALQTNKEQLKGVDVGTEKFDKVIGATFNKTNQDYFGGTNYEVDEGGNIIKKDTVKGKAGDLQKFVVGAFPGLKANPVDIYDDDFRKNLQAEYKKQYGKSLSDQEADAIVNVYLYSAGAGQAVGQVAQEVASEYAFRNLAKSTIPGAMKGTTAGTWKSGARLGGLLAVEAAPFGFLEGATGEITQSSFEKREQDAARITTAGLSGALTSSTFNFIGGGLTGRFGSKGGKLTQFGGWLIDPPGEILGDKIVDVGTRGGLNVVIPGIATTTASPGGTTTSTKTTSDAQALKTKLGGMSMVDLGLYNMTSQENAIMNNALQSQLSQDVRGAKTKASEAKAIKTAEDQFSSWIKSGQITIEPSVGVNTAANTDTRGKGGTNTNVNDNTNTDNTNNTNTTTDTTTNVFNEENVNNETTSEVNVNVFNDTSTTSTSVNVPIITPAGGAAFPFFFPFAGNAGKNAQRKKKLLYYNELDAARNFYEGLQFGGRLPFKKKRGVKK